MLVHSLFIESVDLFRLRRPSGGSNALGNRFDRCQFAPGKKKLGTLARKGACYSAADVPSRAVNYCYFVLQHHFRFLSSDELRAAAERQLHVAAFFPPVHVSIVRAVDDVDTSTAGNWAVALHQMERKSSDLLWRGRPRVRECARPARS